MEMKVVAVNGSARKNGNTAMMIEEVARRLSSEGIGTETIELSGMKLRGCTACYGCVENRDNRCTVDDGMNEIYSAMVSADGIILASPTYFSDVSAEMKAVIDRCGMVARANGSTLRRKVGASIVAVRRGGSIHAFDTMNHFFLIGEMIVVGSSYWNMGFGRNRGEFASDEEGIKTMRDLGSNMAYVLKRLNGEQIV